MTKTKVILILLTLSLIILACSVQATPSAPTPEPAMTTIVEWVPTPMPGNLAEADVPRVSLEKARAAIASGAAVVIDVRSSEAFEASHIPGALNIPMTTIEADPVRLNLNKDQWIITYCTSLNEHTSARAALALLQSGYTNVEALLGGFQAWTEAGYPVEP